MGVLNIYCTHCGAENLRGRADCASCGKPLKGASSTPPAGRTVAGASPEPTSPVRFVTPPRVVVTDIEIPFFSMMNLMLKWFFASIPVLLMIGVFLALIGGVFTGCLAALGSGLRPR